MFNIIYSNIINLEDEIEKLRFDAIYLINLFMITNKINFKFNFVAVISLLSIFISFFLICLFKKNVIRVNEQILNTFKFIQNIDFRNLLKNFIYINVLLLINLPALTSLSSKSPLVFLVTFCLQPTFLIPTSLFLISNTNILSNISLTNKPKMNQVFLNDSINLTSFWLRFFSQFIRIALITIILFLFYEYLAQITFNLLNNWVYWVVTIISMIIKITLRVLLELIDVFFVFFIQISAYFSIIFWLLSFLFLIKLSNFFEVNKKISL